MLTRIKLLPALLLLAPAISLATPPPADTHSPIVIVFQDGHRQTLDMSDLAASISSPPSPSFSKTATSRPSPPPTLLASNSNPPPVFPAAITSSANGK